MSTISVPHLITLRMLARATGPVDPLGMRYATVKALIRRGYVQDVLAWPDRGLVITGEGRRVLERIDNVGRGIGSDTRR